jgi:hypothetical protein
MALATPMDQMVTTTTGVLMTLMQMVILPLTFAQNVALAHPHRQRAWPSLAGMWVMAPAIPMTQLLVTTTPGVYMTRMHKGI